MDPHRLIRWSHVGGKQHDVAERLFMAYFNLGLDVGDRAVLAKIAGDAGMDSSEVSTKLESDADVDAVNAEVERVYRMGVTGVPCFIFAQKQADWSTACRCFSRRIGNLRLADAPFEIHFRRGSTISSSCVRPDGPFNARHRLGTGTEQDWLRHLYRTGRTFDWQAFSGT